MNKTIATKKLVTIALLTAVSVVLRLLGFPQSGTFRIELGFIPIALCGAVFGPVWGGISYVLADLVGTLCTGQIPAPTITLCKLLMGAIYGFCFYKRERNMKNILISVTLITVFIDLIAMPLALVPIMGGKSFWSILTSRVWASLVNVPLRIGTLFLTFKYLGNFISKEAEKYGHR